MTTAFAATIDVRDIPPRERHPLIFNTFEGLRPGQSLQLVNDHDPLPLRAQFELKSKGRFSWDYLVAGPDVWRVQIGRSAGPVGTEAGNCCSGGACGG